MCQQAHYKTHFLYPCPGIDQESGAISHPALERLQPENQRVNSLSSPGAQRLSGPVVEGIQSSQRAKKQIRQAPFLPRPKYIATPSDFGPFGSN